MNVMGAVKRKEPGSLFTSFSVLFGCRQSISRSRLKSSGRKQSNSDRLRSMESPEGPVLDGHTDAEAVRKGNSRESKSGGCRDFVVGGRKRENSPLKIRDSRTSFCPEGLGGGGLDPHEERELFSSRACECFDVLVCGGSRSNMACAQRRHCENFSDGDKDEIKMGRLCQVKGGKRKKEATDLPYRMKAGLASTLCCERNERQSGWIPKGGEEKGR